MKPEIPALLAILLATISALAIAQGTIVAASETESILYGPTETTEPESESRAAVYPVDEGDAPAMPAEPMPVEERSRGDVLTMPQPSYEPARAIGLPQRGMSMDEVERQFGNPMERHSAVGRPPITRWDYDGFSVFFEGRKALHAVQKDRPAEIYRKNELQP